MTQAQQHICEEFIKQGFRDNLPPIEAETAIKTFDAIMDAKRHGNKSIIELINSLFPF